MAKLTTVEEQRKAEKIGVKLSGVFYTEDSNLREEEIDELFSEMFDALKCNAASDLTADKFEKKSNLKATLAEWLEKCCDVMDSCRDVLRAANSTVDKLKGEKIQDQKSINRLQDEIIKKQSEELQTVQNTVETGMKSYVAAVTKNLTPAITPRKLKAVVREAVARDDKGKNLMIFGLKEDEGEDLKEKITVVLGHLGEKPHVSECSRVGREGTDKPVKITLRSSEAVRQILAKSSRLRKVVSHKSVYLSPDRTKEEREVYTKLTQEMKRLTKEHPEKYYFIRSRKICHTDRRPREGDTTS